MRAFEALQSTADILLVDTAAGLSQNVMDFILSAEGQAIISAQGTVNLAEGRALDALWAAKKAAFGL